MMKLSEARILHLSKYYYPYIGGTEQVARDIVRSFISTGAKQKVICFNENSKTANTECFRDKTVHDYVDGVEILRCGCQTKLFSQSLSFSYGHELSSLIERFKPNIIFLHYPNPFATHFLLKYSKQDFKLLVYWHLDITKQRFLKHFFYRQNIRLINRADKILGATPKHLEESEFTKQFGNKKFILPYMIDENRLKISDSEKEEARIIKKKYSNKIICFFMGRHVAYKGLSYLIKASKELGDKNIQFIIAGEGELTPSLKEEAKNDDKIEFIGKINDSEKRMYLYASDIICFPSISRNEGFGLALAEGMYFGHPAVTFTIPGSGVNYVNLNGITGIECENGNYIDYSRAIRQLAINKTMRDKMGEEARNRIINYYLPDKFYRKLLILFKELGYTT